VTKNKLTDQLEQHWALTCRDSISLKEEESMDSNSVGVQKHLKGVDSPANSEGSAPTAESNDVPAS
jgi:hypothetical protein